MIEPPGLGERGSLIFQAKAPGVTDPAALGLVVELARTADRLDELDNIIQGKGVLNLMQFRVLSHVETSTDTNINVEVKFGAPLAEARQQQQRYTELYRAVEALSPAVPAVVAAPETKTKTATDELAARRRAREKRRKAQ
ncbi:hypothetical protein [Paeniglutamicibacter terrestris]|uniref:Condensation domain-containing protein n=1 Tax=Paeniglutamicibacter terrestris TaxID=2723403 RepID=A0ABX1G4C5_9MICC|nr:hypothetical protein [Paeniglutamicibacter terrestris]NKG21097.1 hypothetical protein [Paeniglutamicibacter terrestris]